VLDLEGLGSESVCRLRLAGTWGRTVLADVVANRNIHLIMIYDSWFAGQVPKSWRKVAVLESTSVATGK